MERQDDSILGEFLVESGDNLDLLERNLITLEREPASREALASGLRALHTIKGTCGFFGFTRLQALMHAAEDLFGRSRDGLLPADAPLCGLLLDTIDDARRLLRTIELQRGEGECDVTGRIESLRAFQEGRAEPTPVRTAPVPAPASTRLLTPLVESGRLSGEALDDAERRQLEGDPRRIGEILVDQGVLHADEVIDALVTREATQRSRSDTHVRVDVQVLDRLVNLASELVMTRNQVLQCIAAQDLGALAGPAHRLDRITSGLQMEIMQTRMRPVAQLWDILPRLVRDVSGLCRKQVSLGFRGGDTELDRSVLEAIRDPLLHLVRNAIGHGIESPDARVAAGKAPEGRLTLSARHQGGQVLIEVSDDGGGIPVERLRERALARHLVGAEAAARMAPSDWLPLIFVRGLSTAETVTSVSGRGVGMDVVKTNVERIGGTVEVRSEAGRGTTFVLRLPLTLAIVPALIVGQDGERFAIPRASLQELLQLRAGDSPPMVEWIGHLPYHRLRDRMLSLVRLSDVLGTSTAPVSALAETDELQVAVVRADGYAFGLVVDGILDAEEIVVKPLEEPYKSANLYAGATILGDGRVALILDLSAIGRGVRLGCEPSAPELGPAASTPERVRDDLLLVQVRDHWRVAVPCDAVTRLEEVPAESIERTARGDVVAYRDRILPIVDLAGALDPALAEPLPSGRLPVLVCEHGGRRVGLAVRAILDIVAAGVPVEPVHGRPGIAGASLLDGRVVDRLDVDRALALALARAGAARPDSAEAA